MKYDVLSIFMDKKASRLRQEQALLEFRKKRYNKPQYQPKIENEEDSDHESISNSESSFNNVKFNTKKNSNFDLKIPLVRASFKAKKPMNKNPLYSYGLQSVLEFTHDNYDHLIGYIDPLGVF